MTAGASYQPGSVTVNGIAQPAFDPVAGFSIPDIPAGGVTTVSYVIVADDPVVQTRVDDFATLNYTITDPISGPRNFQDNSNTVSVLLVNTEILLIKSVDRAYAQRGDLIHYTVRAQNDGSSAATALTFRDPIPAGTTFVAGSVKIAGVSQPAADPAAGFPLPDIPPAGSVIVEFDVRVN